MCKVQFFIGPPPRILLLAILAIAAPAWPQQRTLTLLPTYAVSQNGNQADLEVGGGKGCAYLYFNADSLPAPPKQIRLRLKQSRDGVQSQQINIAVVEGTAARPGDWSQCEKGAPGFPSDAPEGGILPAGTIGSAIVDPSNLPRVAAGHKYIALFLGTSVPALFPRAYYGTKRDVAPDPESSNRPRLVITYSVGPPDSASSDGWPSVRSLFQFVSSATRFIQGTGGAEAARVAETLSPAGAAGNPSASGPEGNLYLVAGLQLIAQSPPLSPPGAPVAAARQEIWRWAIGTAADARITVSPNGRYLYAAGMEESTTRPNDKDPVFYAINTATGKAVKLPGLPAQIKQFHNPIVLRQADGDSVFLTANSGDHGFLLRVRNAPGNPDDPTADPRWAPDSPKGAEVMFPDPELSDPPRPDRNFQVSQGIFAAGTDLYYFVKTPQGAVLRRLDAKNPDVRPVTADFETVIPETGARSGLFLSGVFWRSANPVIDSGGRLIFYDTQNLFLMTPKFDKVEDRVLQIPFPDAGQPGQSAQLAFAESGRLYARTKDGILPVIPSLNASRYDSISSAADVQLTGTVPAGKTVVVEACGSISLAHGFRVTRDNVRTAGLTVKRGPNCPSK